MKKAASWLVRSVRMIAVRFFNDRLTYAASALTFSTLLALVPLITVFVTILSAFPVFHSLISQVQQFVLQNFIPASGEVVQKYLSAFVAQTSQLSAIGLGFLVVTAVMMMLTIERAFNDIWKVHRQRQGLRAILTYWAILSLAPIFIALSIGGTSYIVSLPLVTNVAAKIHAGKFLVGNIHIFITILALMLLYIGVPNCKVHWRYGFIGAVIATFLFEVAKRIFIYYLTNYPTYTIIYGAMATIPIFLIWIYFIWVIVLIGALISNVLSIQQYGQEVGEVDGFSHAFLWLQLFWQAQQKGEGVTQRQLHKLLPANYQIGSHEMLLILEQNHLIRKVGVNEYILIRDLSHITIGELYQMLPWKISTKTNSIFTDKAKKLLAEVNQKLNSELDKPLSEFF